MLEVFKEGEPEGSLSVRKLEQENEPEPAPEDEWEICLSMRKSEAPDGTEGQDVSVSEREEP